MTASTDTALTHKFIGSSKFTDGPKRRWRSPEVSFLTLPLPLPNVRKSGFGGHGWVVTTTDSLVPRDQSSK